MGLLNEMKSKCTYFHYFSLFLNQQLCETTKHHINNFYVFLLYVKGNEHLKNVLCFSSSA